MATLVNAVLAHHGLQVDPYTTANNVRLALQNSNPVSVGQMWLREQIEQINSELDRLEEEEEEEEERRAQE
jgi:hypothetical protein